MSKRRTVLATRQHFKQRGVRRKPRPSDLADAAMTVATTMTVAMSEAADAIDVIARGLTFEGLVAGLERDCRQIVDGQGTPSPRPHTQRWYALKILEHIGFARAAFANREAQSAATAAFVVGLFAGGLKTQDRRIKAGAQARGKQLSEDALADARDWIKHKRKYEQSDSLQEQYRSLVSYLRAQTGRSERTIRRGLKRLRR